jgi:hypothetical protein
MGSDRQRSIDRSAAIRKAGNGQVEPGVIFRKERSSAPRLAGCPALLVALDVVVAAGDAVIVGTTRDGGALSFTILRGEDREKIYIKSSAELAELAIVIQEQYALFRGATPTG